MNIFQTGFNDLKNNLKTGWGDFRQGKSSPIFSGLGSAVGGIAGNAIGGGKTFAGSGVFDAVSQIGSMLPGPMGMAVGAGAKILGGVANAAFGSKYNDAKIAEIEDNIAALNNFQSNASSFDEMTSNWMNATQGMGFTKSDVGSDGWLANGVKKKFNSLSDQQAKGVAWVNNSLFNNLGNIKDSYMSGLRQNSYEYGGIVGTNGGLFSNGLIFIDEGGTHSENPLGGVPVGMGANGKPNLFEEGEAILDGQYSFSKTGLFLNPKDAKTLGLNGRMSFADAAKKLSKESEERPNDPISMESFRDALGKLAGFQEQERAKKEAIEGGQNQDANIFKDAGATKTAKRGGGLYSTAQLLEKMRAMGHDGYADKNKIYTTNGQRVVYDYTTGEFHFLNSKGQALKMLADGKFGDAGTATARRLKNSDVYQSISEDQGFVTNRRKMDQDYAIQFNADGAQTVKYGKSRGVRVPQGVIDALSTNFENPDDRQTVLGIMSRETDFGYYQPYDYNTGQLQKNYFERNGSNTPAMMMNNHQYFISPVRGRLNSLFGGDRTGNQSPYVYGRHDTMYTYEDMDKLSDNTLGRMNTQLSEGRERGHFEGTANSRYYTADDNPWTNGLAYFNNNNYGMGKSYRSKVAKEGANAGHLIGVNSTIANPTTGNVESNGGSNYSLRDMFENGEFADIPYKDFRRFYTATELLFDEFLAKGEFKNAEKAERILNKATSYLSAPLYAPSANYTIDSSFKRGLSPTYLDVPTSTPTPGQPVIPRGTLSEDYYKFREPKREVPKWRQGRTLISEPDEAEVFRAMTAQPEVRTEPIMNPVSSPELGTLSYGPNANVADARQPAFNVSTAIHQPYVEQPVVQNAEVNAGPISTNETVAQNNIETIKSQPQGNRRRNTSLLQEFSTYEPWMDLFSNVEPNALDNTNTSAIQPEGTRSSMSLNSRSTLPEVSRFTPDGLLYINEPISIIDESLYNDKPLSVVDELTNDAVNSLAPKTTTLDPSVKPDMYKPTAKAKSDIFSADNLMNMGVIGSGIQALTDTLGLTNKADYSDADRLINAARGYTPSQVSFTPITQRMNPSFVDTRGIANSLINTGNAGVRALRNSGLSRGQLAGSLLSSNFNLTNSLGKAYMDGMQQQRALDGTILNFNRETDKFNSEGAYKANAANAAARQSAFGQYLSTLQSGLAMRTAERNAIDAAKSANLSGFLNNLQNLGLSKYRIDKADANEAYVIDTKGNYKGGSKKKEGQ